MYDSFIILDGRYLHLRENSTLSKKVHSIPVIYVDSEGMFCLNRLKISIPVYINLTAIIKQVRPKVY